MLYRLYDLKSILPEAEAKKYGGVFPVENIEQAKVWNDKRWGIFRAVNVFNTPERKKENLKQIRAWFVDIDCKPKNANERSFYKAQQRKKISISPLVPSKIIESKNGYHVYFYSYNASVENYESIQTGLINFFDGDRNAKDYTRILREPGFNHWKDPNDPFKIKTISELDIHYKECDLVDAFNDFIKINPINNTSFIEQKSQPLKLVQQPNTPDLLDALHKAYKRHHENVIETINQFNQMDLLKLISGIDEVENEHFTFQQEKDITRILVNNRKVNAWIDEFGKIGSTSNGGPTVLQWLMWYGEKPKNSYEIDIKRRWACEVLRKNIFDTGVVTIERAKLC